MENYGEVKHMSEGAGRLGGGVCKRWVLPQSWCEDLGKAEVPLKPLRLHTDITALGIRERT